MNKRQRKKNRKKEFESHVKNARMLIKFIETFKKTMSDVINRDPEGFKAKLIEMHKTEPNALIPLFMMACDNAITQQAGDNAQNKS